MHHLVPRYALYLNDLVGDGEEREYEPVFDGLVTGCRDIDMFVARMKAGLKRNPSIVVAVFEPSRRDA